MTTRGHHGLLLGGGGGGGVPGSIPSFVSAGTFTAGAASISVPWGAGHAVGDVGLLVVQTADEDPGTVSGWTKQYQLGTGTPGTTLSPMLTIYSRTAASTSESNASVPDSGNHTFASILVFRGVDTSAPIDAQAQGTGTTTSITLPGVTTTDDNRLVVTIVADSTDIAGTTRYSSWTMASLSSFTEILDAGQATAAGGGIGAAAGGKASAGSTSTGTVTFSLSASPYIAMTLALKPPLV